MQLNEKTLQYSIVTESSDLL